MQNLTPLEFTEAIEGGTDVSPTVLQHVLKLVGDGSADLVVYNQQTGGPQTDAVLEAASKSGVPAIGVSETLPQGRDYLEWQTAFLQDVLRAVVT